MKIWKKSGIFLLGGGIYVTLELLWRGRSHPSMFAAGGLCLVLVGNLGQKKHLPMPLRVILGTGIIVLVELVTGLLVNRQYRVWDYRDMPGNLWGQVCPQYAALWMPLSCLSIVVYEKLERIMK